MPAQVITSWEELQRNINRIVVALERDDNLKIAAASNPFYALEELGFEILAGLKSTFEDKLRFLPGDAGRLAELRHAIFRYAGKEFDIRNKQELNSVLFDDLHLVAFDDKGCSLNPNIPVLTKNIKYKGDPLLEYKGLHPIVAPLLEFRDIDSTVPGFSNKEDYLSIRNGTHIVNSRVSLSIRLKPH